MNLLKIHEIIKNKAKAKLTQEDLNEYKKRVEPIVFEERPANVDDPEGEYLGARLEEIRIRREMLKPPGIHLYVEIKDILSWNFSKET